MLVGSHAWLNFCLAFVLKAVSVRNLKMIFCENITVKGFYILAHKKLLSM